MDSVYFGCNFPIKKNSLNENPSWNMGTHLSTGGMYADGVVQLIFGNPTFHGSSKSLRDLSSIRAQIMKTNYTILKPEKYVVL